MSKKKGGNTKKSGNCSGKKKLRDIFFVVGYVGGKCWGRIDFWRDIFLWYIYFGVKIFCGFSMCLFLGEGGFYDVFFSRNKVEREG